MLRMRTLLFGLLLALPLHAAPDVQEILRKMVEHGEDPSQVERRNSISYQRTSRVEYLNEDGTVKRDSIRVYRISPENGQPVTRLLSINGRPASEKDEAKKSAARETGEKSRMLGLSEDILSRYQFTFVREEEFGSRRAWVLKFVPKPDAPSETFIDRLVNAMSGTMWIDQEEHQLAKADIHLSKRVSFFGGIAGAIDKLDLTLIQRRVEPGVWLGEAVHIDFTGRKLFSAIRFRCFENCANFERVPGAQARVE